VCVREREGESEIGSERESEKERAKAMFEEKKCRGEFNRYEGRYVWTIGQRRTAKTGTVDREDSKIKPHNTTPYHTPSWRNRRCVR
jgi:hypothetical protein